MHSYVVEYLNENEFKKIERSLKKYNMLAYKKLIFDYVPSLRDGNFQGVVVSKNSKEGIVKYELKLPTDRMFSKVHGDIVLHYTLYENQKPVSLYYQSIKESFIFHPVAMLPIKDFNKTLEFFDYDTNRDNYDKKITRIKSKIKKNDK